MSDQDTESTLNYPYGSPFITGKIKLSPDDFKVYEQLGFELAGEGEHLFLQIEKAGLTTLELIDQIASQSGVSAKHIGYSGLKDKHAVTRQWLSLQIPGCKQSPQINDGENYRILSQGWHDKKLRTGSHKFNKFDIAIRQLDGNINDIQDKIEKIKQFGFANYFGQQRFGSKNDNVQQALKALGNRHRSKRLSRRKKSLFLSALRSDLFNQILNRRISHNTWQQPIAGDLFILSGSQSVFSQTLDEELIQRYQHFDIHSAISLYGIGESRLVEQALMIEDAVFSENPEIVNTLNMQEIKRSYRANRATVSDLKTEMLDDSTMKLMVKLEKGVFLTSLLNHFVKV